MGISTASHFSRHPGKFQAFGKPSHCTGLTGWMRQMFTPSRKRHSPLGLSMMLRPVRLALSRVHCSMNSRRGMSRNEAMRVTSSSVTRTSPGQRQQLPQRWQAYQGVDVSSGEVVLMKSILFAQCCAGGIVRAMNWLMQRGFEYRGPRLRRELLSR